MSNRIHLSKASISELEEEYVLGALRSGWIAPLGPEVDAFEQEIAQHVGVNHALALSSGTAALHLALLEVGARPGTFVVLPSMTFAATANAVMYTGATPFFVDSQTHDANVDPELLVEAVRDLRRRGKEVAAAMTVDLFGRCAAYDILEDALAGLNVPLIEDAAEALGSSVDSRCAGSFGTAAALSFNGNKILSTSGGGMLLSNNESLIRHARKLSTQAREDTPWYEHTEIGYNYRLSNILAALGRAQLVRLDELRAGRQRVRQLYEEGLGDLHGLRFLGRPSSARYQDNAWLTCIVLDRSLTNTTPDDLISALAGNNIEARHLWKPMHLQPAFSAYPSLDRGISERLFDEGVTLPSSPTLTEDEVERVIKIVRSVIERSASTTAEKIT